MKLKNSRWTMVMVGVIGLLMVRTMVWASPQAGAPSAPLEAYDAKNADKVDGLHASKRPNANTLLALRKNKKFPASVIPGAITRDKEVMTIVKNNDGAGSGLDADLLDGQDSTAFAAAGHNHDDAYLNDDQQETITASLNGTLLTVNNTYAGSGIGVYGYGTTGTGVWGESSGGMGVWGDSSSGTGVFAYSDSGLPLEAMGLGTNIIEAWQGGVLANLRFKVELDGDVYIDGSYYDTGADFAEMMATSEGVTYEPGDLLVIGPDGKPLPSSIPNTTNLLGVYSADPGFVGGIGDEGDTEGKIPVAITGIVPVKASAENGAILPGDLLASSSIRGHAMKASPVDIEGITFYLPGTILGKALESLEEGTGVILVLVTLQ